MLPILFSVGQIKIYTLSFLIGVGFFLASFIIWRRLRELGLQEEKIIDLIIFSGISGIFSSRIFYIMENFEDFGFFFSYWFLIGRYPGFSFWGGIIGAFLAIYWFIKKQKWEIWKVSDEIVFGVLPLLVLIQLGSFFDGSGQGRPTNMPWGLFFPGSLVRRQPVSLFSSIFLLAIWIFLLKIERQWRDWEWYKSKAEGFITLIFFILFFALNFLLAFWKENRLYFYWLEIILYGICFFIALLVFYIRSGRRKIVYGKSEN